MKNKEKSFAKAYLRGAFAPSFTETRE